MNPDGGRIHKKTVWDRAKKAGLCERAFEEDNHLDRRNGHPKHRYVLRRQLNYNSWLSYVILISDLSRRLFI